MKGLVVSAPSVTQTSLIHFGVLASQAIICRNGLKYYVRFGFNSDVVALIVLVQHHSELVKDYVEFSSC